MDRQKTEEHWTGDSYSFSNFNNIPSEIFIEICKNITPLDLAKLSLVCQSFWHCLSSRTSSTTQMIWRFSREQFLCHPKLPPPADMCEQDYISLVLYNKCHFCKNGNSLIAWVFRKRFCKLCLKERTICYDNFDEAWKKIPLKAIRGLRYNKMYSKIPYTEKYELHRYYLIEDIKTLYDEFIVLVLQNKDKDFIASWELDKQMKGNIYMEEISKYSKEQSSVQSTILRSNMIKLGNILDSLMEERSIDDNRPKYDLDILYDCLDAKNAFSTTDQLLLNEKEFKIMRESLIAMYPEIKKKRNKKRRSKKGAKKIRANQNVISDISDINEISENIE
ncbi:784_t:CDS:2, partial [Dentiscutata erythropus]